MSALPPLGLLTALALLACGPPPKPPPPDAGPDTSCGLDCAAQERFGLTIGRCFEYSTTTSPANPAELGVLVKKLEELEGGVQALPFEYRQSGQVRMTDYLTIRGGDLFILRRGFLPGQSVTYKDSTGAIVGAKWLGFSTGPGESFTTTAEADVIGSGDRRTETTSFKVTTTDATSSELLTPQKRFDAAVKVIHSETPDHGADPRRVWVGGTGFILFSSYFSPTVSGTAQEYRLQRIRDIGTADAGTEECGLGTP